MNNSGWWAKLVWRNRLLAYSGLCYVLLFAALAVIAYLNLRVAHALALHAIQAIPIVGYVFRRIGKRFGPIPAVVMTFAYAAVYLTWATILFVDAIKGRPLIKFN